LFNRYRGCKTSLTDFTPDDRGYSEFNRWRGL